MTLSDYSHLKQQIIFSVGTSDRHIQLLNELKEIFKYQINSPRRFDQIKTIGLLLKVLEIRDVLSQDQISPLRAIAFKLHNSDEILMKISDYESSRVPREYVNYYATKPESLTNATNKACGKDNTRTETFNMSPKKRERVLKIVTQDIGCHWKDLSRNLKIREGIIDDIDNSNTTIHSKIAKALEVFEDMTDRHRWFFDLCNALKKSRRGDIVKALQDVMMMDI